MESAVNLMNQNKKLVNMKTKLFLLPTEHKETTLMEIQNCNEINLNQITSIHFLTLHH